MDIEAGSVQRNSVRDPTGRRRRCAKNDSYQRPNPTSRPRRETREAFRAQDDNLHPIHRREMCRVRLAFPKPDLRNRTVWLHDPVAVHSDPKRVSSPHPTCLRTRSIPVATARCRATSVSIPPRFNRNAKPVRVDPAGMTRRFVVGRLFNFCGCVHGPQAFAAAVKQCRVVTAHFKPNHIR